MPKAAQERIGAGSMARVFGFGWKKRIAAALVAVFSALLLLGAVSSPSIVATELALADMFSAQDARASDMGKPGGFLGMEGGRSIGAGCFYFHATRDVTNGGNDYKRGLVSVNIGSRPISAALVPTSSVCGVWMVKDTAPSESWTLIGDSTCGLGKDVVWFGTTPVVSAVRRFSSWSDLAACVATASGAPDPSISEVIAMESRYSSADGLLGLCDSWPKGASVVETSCGDVYVCDYQKSGGRVDGFPIAEIAATKAANSSGDFGGGWWRMVLCETGGVSPDADAVVGDAAAAAFADCRGRWDGAADAYVGSRGGGKTGRTMAIIDTISQRKRAMAEEELGSGACAAIEKTYQGTLSRCSWPCSCSRGRYVVSREIGDAVDAHGSSSGKKKTTTLRMARGACGRWDAPVAAAVAMCTVQAWFAVYSGMLASHGLSIIASMQGISWATIAAVASANEPRYGLSAFTIAAASVLSAAVLLASAASGSSVVRSAFREAERAIKRRDRPAIASDEETGKRDHRHSARKVRMFFGAQLRSDPAPMIAWALWWRRSAVAWSVAQVMLSAVPLLSFSLDVLSIVFAVFGAISASVPLASLAMMGSGALATVKLADEKKDDGGARKKRESSFADSVRTTIAPLLRIGISAAVAVVACCACAVSMQGSVHSLVALSAAAASASGSISRHTAEASAALLSVAFSVIFLISPACVCAASMVPYDDHAMASARLNDLHREEEEDTEEEEYEATIPEEERDAVRACKRGDHASCDAADRMRGMRLATKITQSWW